MNRIDDLGMVTIPKKIRNSLGWVRGDKMELVPNVDEKSLLVKLANLNSENHYVICEKGNVKIPKKILDLLGWECEDTLEYIVDVVNKSITMMKVT